MKSARRGLAAGLLVVGSLSAYLVVTSTGVRGAEETCLGEAATIIGDTDAAPGDGTITGTADADVIIGTEGDDVIVGAGGDDRICGLGGEDELSGEDGFDRLNGGPGTDTCDGERLVNCEEGVGEAPVPTPEPSTTTTTAAPSEPPAA